MNFFKRNMIEFDLITCENTLLPLNLLFQYCREWGMSRRIKNIFYTSLRQGSLWGSLCGSLWGLSGCSGLEDSERKKIREMNAVGEYVHRTHDEFLFEIPPPTRRIRESYPWEDVYVGKQIKITKEFFRCKGSQENPPFIKEGNGNAVYISDCMGTDQHSLPVNREGKEQICIAMIDLLNHIQEKTRKKVMITCGYRCPTHNTYADSSIFNQTSKHMIGAEVDFYVKGLEWCPEKIVEIITDYYQEHPKFKNNPQFSQFSRYEKETNVSTLPWFNKEIFIKLFKKDEGRDLDNIHKFPYISIQIKWDRDKNEPVTYSWREAFNGYLRY